MFSLNRIHLLLEIQHELVEDNGVHVLAKLEKLS